MESDYKLKHMLAVISLCLVVYCAYWFFLNQSLNRTINTILGDMQLQGYVIKGNRIVNSGFPGIPTIYFSGEVITSSMHFVIPEMYIRSFYIPGTTTRLSFPSGFAVNGKIDPEIASVDRMDLVLLTPKSFPKSANIDDIAKWQREVGAVHIKSLKLKKNETNVSADGFIALDKELQPKIKLDIKATGYKDFLSLLKNKKFIKESEEAMASLALDALSEPDPITKEPELKTTVTLQNQILSLGPVQVGRLPAIVWGRRSLPVRLRR